jgi:3-dehydroquinate dehydratase
MTHDELVKHILGNKQHFMADVLVSWLLTSDRFTKFAYFYRDKIRKRIFEATNDEGLNDLMSELEVAYLLLLDERFEVEYEKNKNNIATSSDYIATFEQATTFALEVTSIHEHKTGSRYEEILREISDRVQKIPSNLAFSLSFNDFEADPEIVNKIEHSKEKIIRYIENTVCNDEMSLLLDGVREYPIPGFKDELVLILSKSSGKIAPDETSYHCESRPVFYTLKEYRKFGDAILDKLHQICPNIINVLVLSPNSTTHEKKHLFQAIYSINKLVSNGDENFFIAKKFRGISDFFDKWKKLSGILFRDNWIDVRGIKARNTLLCNKQADRQIPEPIAEYLRQMNKPTAFRLG